MSAPTPAPPPSVRSILVVDDEQIVLSALKETLEREKYHVVACSSPVTALRMVGEQEFGVIISDQKMPEMLGLDFLIESRRLQPNSSRILITTVLSLPTIVDAINKGEIFRFVAKPWLREELLATVRNAIQRHDLITHNNVLQAETARLNEQLTAANQALEAKVHDLELQRQRLDAANRELTMRSDHTVELCRRILTAYDPILGGQAKVLVELASKMAETEHFTETERHALRAASWLCDLGLIGVPRALLRTFSEKPDDITPHERAMLQNHPIYSQTLAAFVDPGHDVGETIRYHHEKFDGTGFPDGISGKAIPWTARCLAVAAGFVESGRRRQDAIKDILAQSGTAFDPEAVRLLLKVTDKANLPRQVREILIEELQPGMILATGIYSPHGLLLVGEGQTLGANIISKIRHHNEIAPISQRLLVYS
jgi:response regulator RpfG family c-di-GMP phosphodiesterase